VGLRDRERDVIRRWSFTAGLFLVALSIVGWTAGALDTSTPQSGRLAFGSVTGTTAGTANAILTLSGRRRIIICTNSLNTETMLTYNGANWLPLPAGVGVAVDLSASGLTFADGKVVGVYYQAAPASGAIGCAAH
jgi:hypothetical protein